MSAACQACYISACTGQRVAAVRNGNSTKTQRLVIRLVQQAMSTDRHVSVSLRQDGYLRVELDAAGNNHGERLWLVPPDGYLVAENGTVTSWTSAAFHAVHQVSA